MHAQDFSAPDGTPPADTATINKVLAKAGANPWGAQMVRIAGVEMPNVVKRDVPKTFSALMG